MKTTYGYVRVSSKDQNIGRQMAAMKEMGISTHNIFIDKQTGKDFNRPEYRRMVKKIRPGDILAVKSIDRLGRNYDEIMEQWRYLVKIKDIDIVVIDFPLLDTRNQINGVTGKFLSDLVLQLLSYIAQVERENIHQRQKEGIRVAKEKGVKFGRPVAALPDDFERVAGLWRSKQISQREAARMLGTNHVTFLRWIKRCEKS